jgi:hypothetical protein
VNISVVNRRGGMTRTRVEYVADSLNQARLYVSHVLCLKYTPSSRQMSKSHLPPASTSILLLSSIYTSTTKFGKHNSNKVVLQELCSNILPSKVDGQLIGRHIPPLEQRLYRKATGHVRRNLIRPIETSLRTRSEDVVVPTHRL